MHTKNELDALQLKYDKLKERLARIERNLRGSVFEVEVEDETPQRTRRGIRKLVDDKPKLPVEPLNIPMSQNLSEDPSIWKELIIDNTMKIQYNHNAIVSEIMDDMDVEFFRRLSEDKSAVIDSDNEYTVTKHGEGKCLECHGTGRVKSGLFECLVCHGTGVHLTCNNCRGSTRPGWIWTGMDGMKWIPCSECNIMQLNPLYPKVPF